MHVIVYYYCSYYSVCYQFDLLCVARCVVAWAMRIWNVCVCVVGVTVDDLFGTVSVRRHSPPSFTVPPLSRVSFIIHATMCARTCNFIFVKVRE